MCEPEQHTQRGKTLEDRILFKTTDITPSGVEGGDSRTLPHLFKAGSGMKRFVVAPDLAYRAGFTKVLPGQGFKTFFWYDEFWVSIEGEADVIALDRPTGTKVEEKLTPHKYVFIPAGTHITLQNNTDKIFLFTYIAVPSSNKYTPWMAYMTPEDIEDIRVRDEHTKSTRELENTRG